MRSSTIPRVEWLLPLLGACGANPPSVSAASSPRRPIPPSVVPASSSAPAEHPVSELEQWRRAPDESTSGDLVGRVTFELLGAKLAESPGAPPHVVVRGAPALLVEGRDFDGQALGASHRGGGRSGLGACTVDLACGSASCGFATLVSRESAPGVVPAHAVTWNDAEGALARVLAASIDPLVARMNHLGIAPELNAALLPWTRVEVGAVSGFVRVARSRRRLAIWIREGRGRSGTGPRAGLVPRERGPIDETGKHGLCAPSERDPAQ
jgi:hypothetical protein